MEDLICPITKQIFHTPVILSDGHCYEEEALRTWLKHSLKSPLTGYRVERGYIRSITMKNIVDRFIEQNPTCERYKPEMTDYILDKLIDNRMEFKIASYDLENYVLSTTRYRKLYKNFELAKYVIDKKLTTDKDYNQVIIIMCDISSAIILFYIIDNVCLDFSVDGYYPIHYLLLRDIREVVMYAIDKLNLKYKDKCESGVVHYVCMEHDLDILKHIVSKGVDINSSDNEFKKPIHIASMAGKFDMVRYLVDLGACLEAEDDKWARVINYLCMEKNLEIIQYIVEKGVYLKSEDREELLPVHYACKYSSPEVIYYMIKKTNSHRRRSDSIIEDRINQSELFTRELYDNVKTREMFKHLFWIDSHGNVVM